MTLHWVNDSFGRLVSASTEYMVFVPDVPKPATKVWRVVNKKSRKTLGIIQWWGPWRQYCINFRKGIITGEELVFSSGCLNDIQRFLDRANSERLAKRREVKA